MDEKKQLNENREISLSSILYVIKHNLLLIILIMTLAIGCGVGYTKLITPHYTSTETVMYRAENKEHDSITNNINAMNAFVKTVIDFCDEGVVVDRANFYYNEYLNDKREEGADYTIEDYIKTVESEDKYDNSPVQVKHIVASNIKATSEVDDDGVRFLFSISYTDEDMVASSEKLSILVYAFDKECREEITIDGVLQDKYFSGIKSSIEGLGQRGPVSDVSNRKIVIVSVFIGIFLSCIVIYIKFLLDNTIQNRQELEELTGVDVLSFIEKQGGK